MAFRVQNGWSPLRSAQGFRTVQPNVIPVQSLTERHDAGVVDFCLQVHFESIKYLISPH